MSAAKVDAVEVLVVGGVEGPSIYLGGYRIAGPKPWGGGKVLYRFTATDADIKEAMKHVKRLRRAERGARAAKGLTEAGKP